MKSSFVLYSFLHPFASAQAEDSIKSAFLKLNQEYVATLTHNVVTALNTDLLMV